MIKDPKLSDSRPQGRFTKENITLARTAQTKALPSHRVPINNRDLGKINPDLADPYMNPRRRWIVVVFTNAHQGVQINSGILAKTRMHGIVNED
jgi:hypothetical protein